MAMDPWKSARHDAIAAEVERPAARSTSSSGMSFASVEIVSSLPGYSSTARSET